MAAWQTMSGGVPGVNTLLEALEAPLAAIAEVAETVETAAEVASGVLEPLASVIAADPLAAAFAAALQVIQDFIDSLVNADIHFIPMLSPNPNAPLLPYTTTAALVDLARSMADSRDPDRPLFGEATSYVSVTLLVGHKNWLDFLRIIRLFAQLFNGAEWNRWSRLADWRVDAANFLPRERADRQGHGDPWDWSRTHWMDLFPPLAKALEAIRDGFEALAGRATGIANAVTRLLKALADRIAYLNELLQAIADIARFLQDLQALLDEGTQYLFVSGSTGGSNQMISDILNAGNAPDYALCGGMTFVAFGPNPIAAMTIFEAIGLRLGQDAEALAAQVEEGAEGA